MKLYLDNIIFALQPAGGISVYWMEMLRHILASGTPVQMVEHPRARQNIQRRMLELPEDAVINDTSIPLKLSRYLPVLRSCPGADIFHSSYYRIPWQRGMKQVVTVYDFTYEFYYSGLQGFVHSRQKSQAILQAHGIICISESTKRDLLRLFPTIHDNKVRVIHLGISDSYFPIEGDTALSGELQWIASTRYVLFVGTRVKYKNFDLAVQTLERLEGYHLVIVGGGPLSEDERTMLDRSLGERYRHLLGMNEQTLNIIYNHAFCLLYPSSYEGFGFPPLEAMQAGCPVVAINTSSLPEVCGDAGLLVSSPEPGLFAQQILSLETGSFRQEVVASGYRQARKFTWDDTYRKTMDFYREVAADGTGMDTAP